MILPMYVVLLLGRWSQCRCCTGRRMGMVLAISAGVYVFGQTVDGMALSAGGFQIAGWQLLFTAGLVVGWEWEHGVAALTARTSGLDRRRVRRRGGRDFRRGAPGAERHDGALRSRSARTTGAGWPSSTPARCSWWDTP